MNTKLVAAKLTPILESCPGSAEFLEGVQRALEALYADCPEACPEGFAALDAAIEAFRKTDIATA